MAKKKIGRPPAGRDDVSVKLDRKIAAKAKHVASDRGTTVAALLSQMLEVPMDKAYREVLKKLDG